jgi:hypothetical protein
MRNSRMRIAAGAAVLLALAGAVAGCKSDAPPDKPPAGPDTAKPAVEEEPAGPCPFEDVTAKSGIALTYKNGEDANNYAIIESLGGGVCLFDYDGDGLLDVFLPGGGFYEGKTVRGHPCKLYRNKGNFQFEDVTAQVGLDQIAFQYSHGAAAFDYDRDGRLDLLVTGYNRLVLLRNETGAAGTITFVEVTKKAGLTETLWSTSAAWGDLDGDGYPELYVCHYGDWGFETNHPTDCTYGGPRDVCQPRKFKPLPHTLYKNNGDGTFADITAAQKLRADGRGIGAVLVDLDNDGRPDVYTANDTDDNFLYMNRGERGKIVLDEVGLLAGVARDDRGVQNGSMGLGIGDYDRGGRASIVVTNYENELPALYQNRTEGRSARFTFATLQSGLAAVGSSYVSWGTGFFDFDRDGWDDLLIVSGHAIRFPTKLDRRQRPVLARNTEGKLKPLASRGWNYFGQPHNARGAAFGDLDNDGRVDVVVSHLNEPVVVLRNVSATQNRNWIGFRLIGTKGADAVGARVVLETAGGKQTKFQQGGASYASTNDPRLLFGMGADAKIAKATVYWPSGKVQELTDLQPGAYYDVPEGEAPKRVAAPKNP